MNDRQALAKTIKAVATYYGRNMDADVLSMMCDDLEDLPIDKVIAGYNQWRRNPANKTFPLPAQIRELVSPGEFIAPETRAREVAGRIVGAITKFGWNNAKEAQVFIGPEGWELVKRMGGWQHLCETTSPKQATMLQAQMRDQLEGVFRYGREAIETSIGALPQARERQGEIEGKTDFVKLVPSTLTKAHKDGEDNGGGAA
jgi:hypothetical protein